MALRQVIVPWTKGYNYGVGAMLSSGSPMGKVVDGTPNAVTGAGGSTVSFQVQRIDETEDLEKSLGIDVEASYGSGAFGGVSARFNFAQKSKVNTSCIFMTVTAGIELAFKSLDSPQLTQAAKDTVDRSDVFESRYGDMFVRGVARGGLFVGLLRIETMNSSESTDMAAKLEGSYGLFSAQAETKFRELQQKFSSSVYIDMYHEGGPADLKINNFQDPMELIRNANTFLESFAQRPDEVAVPYYVTLAPIAIAEGAMPANEAEIQRAQDVIVNCAKRRSVLMDLLNLMEYIADNPDKYDFTNGANIEEIKKVSSNAQMDLELIADCASAAMNNRASAMLPVPFAQANGREFPLAAMPTVLPIPKQIEERVEVPDFRQCTTWTACRELAKATGFTLTYEYQGSEPAPFRVIDFRPPAGTYQPKGSTVTVTCPPDPPSRFFKTLATTRLQPWTKHLIVDGGN